MPRPAQPVAPPPAGFVARPARPSDAAAVARVIAADEERHRGRATTTAEQVTADWAGADLEQDSVVVEDAQGRVVAVGDAVPNRAELLLAYGYVDPTRSGEGLGAYLVGFFEARARRLAAGAGAPAPDAPPVRVRHYLPEANAGARRLLEGRGYAFVRAVLGMERELEGPLPAPAWPAGVSVRDYRGGADEPAVYEAFELGSSGMWGRPGNDFEQWAPRCWRRRWPTCGRAARARRGCRSTRSRPRGRRASTWRRACASRSATWCSRRRSGRRAPSCVPRFPASAARRRGPAANLEAGGLID